MPMPSMANSTHPPLAIFIYNRPAHTQRMIESLWTNPEFADSPVWIFCDGPKTHNQEALIAETRSTAKALAPKHAVIIERDRNLGLAKSILAGISELCDEYGRVIVCEDDLFFSPLALGYLNHALRLYKDEERAMHVSAYMFPVEGRLPQAFFYREATCWGWATWARAWSFFEPDGRKILAHINERGLEGQFDVNGMMFFSEILKKQIQGRVDSWAIRWYGSIFVQGGLALHPAKSFVQNLGFDGTGVHCNKTTQFDVAVATKPVIKFPKAVEENSEAVTAMMRYRGQYTGRLPQTGRQQLAGFAKRQVDKALGRLKRALSS